MKILVYKLDIVGAQFSNVARKGKSIDAVSFETKTMTLKIPRALTRDMISFMYIHKFFANRADFMINAIRWFNQYTLDFMLSTLSAKDVTDSDYQKSIQARKERLSAEMDSYVDLKADVRYEDSVTFKITSELQQCCIILNEKIWRFKKYQDYMRVGIAWYVKMLREMRRKLIDTADKIDNEVFSFICPFDVPRGPEMYDEGELMIDLPEVKKQPHDEELEYDDLLMDAWTNDDKKDNGESNH